MPRLWDVIHSLEDNRFRFDTIEQNQQLQCFFAVNLAFPRRG